MEEVGRTDRNEVGAKVGLNVGCIVGEGTVGPTGELDNVGVLENHDGEKDGLLEGLREGWLDGWDVG